VDSDKREVLLLMLDEGPVRAEDATREQLLEAVYKSSAHIKSLERFAESSNRTWAALCSARS